MNKITARLLAQENIEVIETDFHTAYFDLETRTLALPDWKDLDPAIEDMLICHEVGHALFTPIEGWHNAILNERSKEQGIPPSYINITEDRREERLFKEKYPGSEIVFRRAAEAMTRVDFFEIEKNGIDLDSLSLMDRINLSYISTHPIKFFDQEELDLRNALLETETFADAVALAKEIYEYDLAHKKEEKLSREEYSVGNKESDKDQMFSAEGEKATENAYDLSPDNYEDIKSYTDEKYREREKEAVAHLDKKVIIPKTSYEDLVKRNCIIPFSTLHEEWKKAEALDEYDCEYVEARKKAVKEFITDSRAEVNMLINNFQIKKSAKDNIRVTVKKTGKLDPKRLHQYKFTEDIFSNLEILPNCQNHGMLFLIDYSGSMHVNIRDVVSQTLKMIMFCKRMNIPFEVYTFTTQYSLRYPKSKHEPTKFNTVDTKSIYVVERINSSLKGVEYADAFEKLFSIGNPRHMSYDVRTMPYNAMGSTPLDTALYAFDTIIDRFKKKTRTEKVCFITLTDGIGRNMRALTPDGKDIDVFDLLVKVEVKLQNSSCMINIIRGHSNIDGSDIINILKKDYDLQTVHIFLTNSTSPGHAAGKALRHTDDSISHDEVCKYIKKHGMVHLNKNYGYDSQIVIPQNYNRVPDNPYEDIDKPTKGSLAKAMITASLNKKKGRIFAEMLSDAMS